MAKALQKILLGFVDEPILENCSETTYALNKIGGLPVSGSYLIIYIISAFPPTLFLCLGYSRSKFIAKMSTVQSTGTITDSNICSFYKFYLPQDTIHTCMYKSRMLEQISKVKVLCNILYYNPFIDHVFDIFDKVGFV